MQLTQWTDQLRSLAGHPANGDSGPESLIGIFQQFRPDGTGLPEWFQQIPDGDQVAERFAMVYQASGYGTRPAGGRDAYFIPRAAPALSVQQAESAAVQFFVALGKVAAAIQWTPLADLLDPLPGIRVLEGKPPKHPKAVSERAGLLLAIEELIDQTTRRWAAHHPAVHLLQPAVYFMACDPFLRDYLLWPWIAGHDNWKASDPDLRDPFASYFQLWRHGVKYRIFADEQVDIYLPRENP